jgi:hypothetical protein
MSSSEAIRHSVTSEAGPADRTPPRRPRSVRRTTTHDSLRGEGLDGPVTVIAQGRDLHTGPDGEPTVLASVRIDATASSPENVLAEITADPADDRLRALAGRKASSGFRRAVEEALPGERDSGTVFYQVLDDLPTALLVSGYAVLAGMQLGGQPIAGGLAGRRRAIPLQQVDMCSGWVDGGVMVAGLSEGIPPYFEGPFAPEPATADPWSWHSCPALPPNAMRRRRRLDVWAGDDVAWVETFFRDSYTRPDGVETVVHEYTVRGAVGLGDGTFRSCVAEYGALPWPECPGALASAGRLAGMPAAGLRQRVRGEFYGVGTCTHLNDTLRALEDVGALIGVLRGRGDVRES